MWVQVAEDGRIEWLVETVKKSIIGGGEGEEEGEEEGGGWNASVLSSPSLFLLSRSLHPSRRSSQQIQQILIGSPRCSARKGCLKLLPFVASV